MCEQEGHKTLTGEFQRKTHWKLELRDVSQALLEQHLWGRTAGSSYRSALINSFHYNWVKLSVKVVWHVRKWLTKDSFQGRGISTMTTVGTMTDNCIMPSEPAPMSEPTVWTAEQGMVWGIINSSVRSCWLILIEVNVGAEKYFDWWGWRWAHLWGGPESLTWKAVCATEVYSSLSNKPWLTYRNAEQVMVLVRMFTLSLHPARSMVLLNTNTHSTVGMKTHMAPVLPSKNSGTITETSFLRYGNIKSQLKRKLVDGVNHAEVTDDEEEWCSLSWWAV